MYIYSKVLRIMRYLITRGLCMPRTSLSLLADTKKCLADLWGVNSPFKGYISTSDAESGKCNFKYRYCS